jgi:hypothetical protein
MTGQDRTGHARGRGAYVVLDGRALAGERAAEEGPQEGIQGRRHSIGREGTRSAFIGRGRRALAGRTARARRRGLAADCWLLAVANRWLPACSKVRGAGGWAVPRRAGSERVLMPRESGRAATKTT